MMGVKLQEMEKTSYDRTQEVQRQLDLSIFISLNSSCYKGKDEGSCRILYVRW